MAQAKDGAAALKSTAKTPGKTSAKPSAKAAAGDGQDAGRLAAVLLDDVEALDKKDPSSLLFDRFETTPQWRKVADAPPAVQAAVAVEAVRRQGAIRRGITGDVLTALQGNLGRQRGYSFARHRLLELLFRKAPPLDGAQWDTVLGELARFEVHLVFQTPFLPRLAAAFKRFAEKNGATPAMASSVEKIRNGLSDPTTAGFKEQKVKQTLFAAVNASPG